MGKLWSAASGEWGEQEAARKLKEKGYRVLGRRVKVGTRDEIDLLARDGDVLVFVEVKTRGSEQFGRPLSAVDRRKRHVLSRAAVRYIRRLKDPRVCFRFDVVEVVGEPGGLLPVVRHIENAFPLDRRYDLPR
jgi:putative endonuclease